MERDALNARLRAYHQHLLSSASSHQVSKHVTLSEVIDPVICNPEQALRRFLPAMYTGTISPSAVHEIFRHLVVSRN